MTPTEWNILLASDLQIKMSSCPACLISLTIFFYSWNNRLKSVVPYIKDLPRPSLDCQGSTSVWEGSGHSERYRTNSQWQSCRAYSTDEDQCIHKNHHISEQPLKQRLCHSSVVTSSLCYRTTDIDVSFLFLSVGVKEKATGERCTMHCFM